MDSIWLVLFGPLLGALLCGTQSSALGRRGTHWVACGSIFCSFLVAVRRFHHMKQSGNSVLFEWLSLPLGQKTLHLGMSALVDPLSLTMLCMICGVAFLIHLFSTSYMADEKDYGRFFARLNLFVATMVLLVLANNLALLLVGWGGVGFASYSLIGFYREKPSAVSAARKAFLINVVGDIGLLLAIFTVVQQVGTVRFTDLFQPATVAALAPVMPWICSCLLVAAYAKSAQLPLHTWLPDAMEGPTPVSALIHAATMVTAGVYLVVRCHPLFEACPDLMYLITDLGALTAIVAASAALVQTDLKRVLAYSTMSQLGYMFMAAGVGAYSAAMFHLVAHAFFKALLFLSAGAVIHAVHGEQDITKMGGLGKQLPFTRWVFLIGALALSGIFPLVGFFSKEAVLGAVFEAQQSDHIALWAVGLVTAVLTAFYSLRAYTLVFEGEPRHHVEHLHKPDGMMEFPLITLAVLTVVAGFAKTGFEITMGMMPKEPHADNLLLEVGTCLLAIAGAGAGFWLHRGGRELALPPTLVGVLRSCWSFDALYDSLFVKPVRSFCNRMGNAVDSAFSQGLPDRLGRLTWNSGQLVSMLQSGNLRLYALAILSGVAAFLLFTFLSFTLSPAGGP